MTEYLTSAEAWTARGGPAPVDYDEFDAWLREVAENVGEGEEASRRIKDFQAAFGDALSRQTLQGISLIKPRGYAGDFEVIDRVYQRSLTTDPQLINWDNYLVNTRAARAVRNRKTYFLNQLEALSERTPGDATIPVLDVASGPARDVFEFLSRTDDPRITFECVEYDPLAITYAQALCHEFLDRINFTKINAFRYNTGVRYPLIWSAGLFDYFDDRRFKYLLTRLYEFLAEGGELIIGNFSTANPDRPYMEVMMEWELFHRDGAMLTQLALECGIPAERIRIGQEPEGVNLFLHVSTW